MQNLFNSLIERLRARKGTFILLMLCAVACIVIGVVTAINFNRGVLPLDLGNVAYIRFLRGGGFGSLLFGMLVANLIVYLAVVLCGFKKFLLPISCIFYFYLIFSMGVIFTSIIIIYGFFTTIIFLLFLLVYFVFEILLLTAILCEIFYMPKQNYFRCCFSPQNSCLIWLSIIYLVLILLFCFMLLLLKNYVLLLIF